MQNQKRMKGRSSDGQENQTGFQSRGIFSGEKARMSIRPGVTFVSEGYGAPRRVLWGEESNEEPRR